MTFTILAIAGIVVLFYIGIPALGKIASLLSEIRPGANSLIKDKTPPAPPIFNNFPDFTNQKNISLTGQSEAGANIKLTFNGQTQESLSDKDGKFSFNLELLNGDNAFFGVAVDTAGNASRETKIYKIVFDNTPPNLVIDTPTDGSQFFGTKQKQVAIKGTAEANVQVTVNDRIVAVDDNGKFQFAVSLNEGENKFVIKATDQAGNTKETDLTLNFTS